MTQIELIKDLILKALQAKEQVAVKKKLLDQAVDIHDQTERERRNLNLSLLDAVRSSRVPNLDDRLFTIAGKHYLVRLRASVVDEVVSEIKPEACDA